MKKVLVLEDEANIRSFVVINLKRAGYEAIEAESGEEALAQALPDDPADANGVLSWHYQRRQRYLEEAGSYGYLLTVPVSARAMDSARARGSLRLEIQCDEGGIALYGRNAGRFPIDIEVRPALQKEED